MLEQQLRQLERQWRLDPNAQSTFEFLLSRQRSGLWSEAQTKLADQLGVLEHARQSEDWLETLKDLQKGDGERPWNLDGSLISDPQVKHLGLGLYRWLKGLEGLGLRVLARVAYIATKDQLAIWREGLRQPQGKTRNLDLELYEADDEAGYHDYDCCYNDNIYEFSYSASDEERQELEKTSDDGHRWQVKVPDCCGAGIWPNARDLEESDPPLTKRQALEAWFEQSDPGQIELLKFAASTDYEPGESPYFDHDGSGMMLSYSSIQESVHVVLAEPERGAECATRALLYALSNTVSGNPVRFELVLQEFYEGLMNELIDWALSGEDPGLEA